MMRREDSATDVRSIPSGQGEDGDPLKESLHLTVLGVCTGSGLGHLDCALVRFGQGSPTAPLRVTLQQVSA